MYALNSTSGSLRKDIEAGQGCLEVCICYRCYARVGGPSVGAEDVEGFNFLRIESLSATVTVQVQV
jgi:hypothetical protein